MCLLRKPLKEPSGVELSVCKLSVKALGQSYSAALEGPAVL